MKLTTDSRGYYPVARLRAADPDAFQQLGLEPLGSKPKFWFRLEGEPRPWLFKEARLNTGEAWVEKAASDIAKVIGLPAAHVELATIEGGLQGVVVESFIVHELDPKTGQILRLGELIHGNEILSEHIPDYDKAKTWGQSEHTWHNIYAALEYAFSEQCLSRQIEKFAGLLVFDALIGNTDRHHENWALLLVLTADAKEPGSLELAPSYDHASALGRELQDEKREEILRSGRMDWYVQRGRGGIFWSPEARHGENPLKLVRLAAQEQPQAFRPWLDRLRNVAEDAILEPIRLIPPEWASESAKRFGREFLSYTLQELRGINP